MEHEKLLKQLIEIKSYSGEEKELRSFITEWFKQREIPVLLQGENIIVHLKGKDDSKAFIFNSHMDTVSAGDAKWKYGAWSPTKVGNKIVGLGASDMKSGLAASMLLTEVMFKNGAPVDLYSTFVVNEEVDGSGTESFSNWFKDKGFLKKYEELAAIFTEPTGLSEIEHGHRGNLFVKVEAIGPSGHSSRPSKVEGKLAVRKIIDFADSLQFEVTKWNKNFPNNYFDPAITIGEFTSIYAGVQSDGTGIEVSSPNKFPTNCYATFDLRTTAEFHEVAYERLEELANKKGVELSMLYPAAPAGFTSPEEKIIKVTQKLAGEKTKLTVSQGSADLGFLSTQGIKAIIFGPGEKDQAHKLNEFCYPAQISKAVKIYQDIVNAWTK